ncbi:aminotransferase class I/II-fold pyridoxal phosphate-dependent enzyme [Candidatus Parcubacteria bacterium]|nr:MAG: aminotransferase class I/II-fold pyridoxal phosphate-dependent enzyme [Candidatus Parcubacteria bacterium]
MIEIPFLRPHLVGTDAYAGYLSEIDTSRRYSNFGPLNARFERRVLAEHFGGEGAVVTVANATSGLMLATELCRRPGGRYVLMPSFTFVATPQAVRWCGLEPYFIDIRTNDWHMDESLVEETLRLVGDEVAAVMPYATFGAAPDVQYYRKLHASGVPVVVDAASSFGSTDETGQFGKGFPGMVVFSFHATKAFGIGEGGMVYSGDAEAAANLRRAANFGFSDEREVIMQGMNAKMSEYAAAVALATLDVFAHKVRLRRQIHRWYMRAFDERGLLGRGWAFHRARGNVPYQFVAALCPDGVRNRDVVSFLAKRGIQSRTYFDPPCHRHSYFRSCRRTPLPITEAVSKRVISLPLWEEMSENHVDRVADALAALPA